MFLNRVFLQERFNRYLWFLASLESVIHFLVRINTFEMSVYISWVCYFYKFLIAKREFRVHCLQAHLDSRLYWLAAASYQDVSLSMKMCAQRKAGRRQRATRASPAVCNLPMIPCGSSPVTRVSRSPLPCEKRSAWGGRWACGVPDFWIIASRQTSGFAIRWRASLFSAVGGKRRHYG